MEMKKKTYVFSYTKDLHGGYTTKIMGTVQARDKVEAFTIITAKGFYLTQSHSIDIVEVNGSADYQVGNTEPNKSQFKALGA
jgi:ribulose-5-phosphate 4-epimerase/fuculose-1-phosphate aldolase